MSKRAPSQPNPPAPPANNARGGGEEETVIFNPVSKWQEHVEVPGLTLFDIHREPRRENGDPTARVRLQLKVRAMRSRSIPPALPCRCKIIISRMVAVVGSMVPNIAPAPELTTFAWIIFFFIFFAVIIIIIDLYYYYTRFCLPCSAHPRSLQVLGTEFHCPVCLGYIRNTRIVKECMHRFCHDCIEKCLRIGKKQCPQCRIHIPSRRSFR